MPIKVQDQKIKKQYFSNGYTFLDGASKEMYFEQFVEMFEVVAIKGVENTFGTCEWVYYK